MKKGHQQLFKKQAKKKRILELVTILIILIIQLTSCISTPKTLLTKIEVPDPIVNGESVVVYDEETDTVKMPLWYWLRLTDYIIDTQSIMQIVE